MYEEPCPANVRRKAGTLSGRVSTVTWRSRLPREAGGEPFASLTGDHHANRLHRPAAVILLVDVADQPARRAHGPPPAAHQRDPASSPRRRGHSPPPP